KRECRSRIVSRTVDRCQVDGRAPGMKHRCPRGYPQVKESKTSRPIRSEKDFQPISPDRGLTIKGCRTKFCDQVRPSESAIAEKKTLIDIVSVAVAVVRVRAKQRVPRVPIGVEIEDSHTSDVILEY